MRGGSTGYCLIDRRTGAKVHLPTTPFEQIVLGCDVGFVARDFFVGAVVRRLAQLFRIKARSQRVA